MNKLLICAFHLHKLRQPGHVIDVHVIVDESEPMTLADCRRMLSPWAESVRLCSYTTTATPIVCQALAGIGVSKGQVVLAAVAGEFILRHIQESCDCLGAHFIAPALPPAGTLDADFMRELSFFDFEFGGKNEWDGAPTRYADNCLRQLSSTHCRDTYPHWAFKPLTHSFITSPLKVLEIGCGPVSRLRWGAIHGEISITGVDPLIDMYAVMLARHGPDGLPNIRCDREINGFAENIDTLLADDEFDLVYTHNSLDHTQQPEQVIENISRKLMPHGRVVIQVATREGTRQNWDQLHQTDIYLKDDQLMYARRDVPERSLLPPSSGLYVSHVQINNPEWLACIIEKHPTPKVVAFSLPRYQAVRRLVPRGASQPIPG
jgi:SAM-dependent methyltransferase